MELSGKRILIIGLGKTGMAVARFLAARGLRAFVTDEKPVPELEGLLASHGLTAATEIAEYAPAGLASVDLVVPSPGVPPSNPILEEAQRRGIEIISEIELAFHFLKPPLIAVTGTNGKTTTTTLIGHILRRGGKKVLLGGNIGDPLIGFADVNQDADYLVVEVSSFQLQWIRSFCPAVAVLLNTTCDHVNYHGTFEAYRRAKERIFENQNSQCLAVINADEPWYGQLSRNIAARTLPFSSLARLEEGIFVAGEEIVYRRPGGGEEGYPLDMVGIPGRHNIENVMAAVATARECGVAGEDVIVAVRGFKGLAHRIEFVGIKAGASYYDDSKGTNVDAVRRALESFAAPVILLMGGRDKDGDFETLAPLIKEKVRELILFGEARQRINRAVGGIVKTSLASTMREAVEAAHDRAVGGDAVLLSPGCASFDEFTDYKHRGDFFKEMVGKY